MMAGRCWRGAAVGLFALGVLSGCTHDGGVTAPSGSGQQEVEDFAPTIGSNTATPTSPELMPLAWDQVVPGAVNHPSFSAMSDSLVVTVETVDGLSVVVAHREGGSDSFTAEPGENVQNIVTLGNVLVFGLGMDEPTGFRLITWEPRTGQISTLLSEDNWFEYALVEQSLYYTEGAPSGEYCLHVAEVNEDLSLTADRTISCIQDGEDLGWLRPVGTGVSFMTRGPGDDCWTLQFVDGKHSAPSTISVDGCIDRGFGDLDAAVWSEPPSQAQGGSYFHAPLYVSTDGAPISLGDSVAGSPAWCGAWLYWLTEREAGVLESSEIRRWKPGEQLQTVYVSPDGDAAGAEVYSTSAPRCGPDGHVYFARLGWWSNAGDELLTYPALSWSPQVDLAKPAPTS